MEPFQKVIQSNDSTKSCFIFRWEFFVILLLRLGFTEPINVKFANTPNGTKAMMGLPLAPSYLAGITSSPQPVLTALPSMRPALNRYRYAAQTRRYSSFLIAGKYFHIIYFCLQIYLFTHILMHRETHERSKYR